MATLRDVAKAAGVSVAAVSYALRGDRKVASETAERIRLAAERLGYRRDALQSAIAARHFRHQEAPVPVAFVCGRVHLDCPALAAIDGELAERGFLLRRIPADEHPDPQRLAVRLHDEGVRIVIVGARDPAYIGLARSMTAAVFWQVESLYEAPGDVVLEAHWTASLWTALERIRDRGWRRIGVVLPSAEPPHWQDAEARAAIGEARRWVGGIDLVPELCAPFPVLHRDLVPWFRRHQPEAVLCLTCGEPGMLREAGIAVPYALLHTNRFAPPYRGMAGWCVDWGRMLAASIDLIELRLRQRDRDDPRIVVVRPRWVDGPSLPSRPV